MQGICRSGAVLAALSIVVVLVPATARAVLRLEAPALPACSVSAVWSCTAQSTIAAADARELRRLPAVAGASAFPVAGPHDFGRSEANRFGGGRGHKGLDMFAACGTPVVAAMAGRVEKAGYEGAAGNYVVVDPPDGRAHVYMHLRHAARVRDGDHVATGEPIGSVGDTGDADGCHLHFELWTAPGWFRGRVVDPEPTLRRWAAAAP
jgi:murein DD-endopeptidase MepM/ murein hydrolase activator NlpD